jgi:hypothetical protein
MLKTNPRYTSPLKWPTRPTNGYQESENIMDFRLTYAGVLLGSSRNNTRARHKHDIRRIFHPQLKRLWEISPHLQSLTDPPLDLVNLDWSLRRRSRVEALAERFSRCGYNFVPLITNDLGIAVCGLEVLFLRTDAPGSLIQSGDIDNRLKTIFDALRMPAEKTELGGYDNPREGETPFFCLLENDNLITKVAVETDTMLESIGPSFNANDARITIRLSIQPREPRIDMKFTPTIFGQRK